MKFIFRIVVIFCLVVVVIILIYLLRGDVAYNIKELDNDYVDFKRDDIDKMVTNNHEVDTFRGSLDQRLKKYIDQYALSWNGVSNETNHWSHAASWVSSRQIYREEVFELGSILNAMATHPVTHADVGYRGTQLKLMLVIDGRQNVVFKPRWYDRDFTVEGLPYRGHDRHNGEIVAFHISRLLELHRVPLAVGRIVDLETDILPVSTERLRNTFFTNGSDTCFYGKCLYCKNQASGVCAQQTKMEGAVILWLPKKYQFQKFRHPWARTYKAGKKARWEWDSDHYCDDVRQTAIYSTGPLLMDIIDTCIFDFIIGNADRHDFEVFSNDTSSMLIMFDNGKSFGNAWHDEHTILAPLYQCRQVRATTVQRLRQMAGGVLSRVLRKVIDREPIAPLLSEPHYEAIDRRLAIVLHAIDQFLRSSSADQVLIVDGYS